MGTGKRERNGFTLLVSQIASNTPAPPPNIASTKLSVSS
jgi:hypothetical protein